MFGMLSNFAPPPPKIPPKDVPPPTPIHFPRSYPQEPEKDNAAAAPPAADGRRKKPLSRLLQGITRPTEISIEHFEALGLHVLPNASMQQLIPDMSVVPDFDAWEKMSVEDALRINDTTRNPISNGNLSPGVQTYLDRKRELSSENNAAFRSIRRIQPPPGQPLLRLGNAYDFFRQLESFTAFWEDTSVPVSAVLLAAAAAATAEAKSAADKPTEAKPADAKAQDAKPGDAKPAETKPSDGDGDGDSVSSASSTAVTDSDSKTSDKDSVPETRFYRTSTGAQMPPEFRLNIVTAFVKLVAYDFGCNVSPPRMEPRLYLNTASAVAAAEKREAAEKEATEAQKAKNEVAAPKRKGACSYFSSGCIFVFRTPITREAARAGIVEGPVAAVSARHTTMFPLESEDGITEKSTLEERRVAWSADKDACIDLARELVAALLTAQQRARHGQPEWRIGEGEWWATKPRWGGGAGGPIGREVDAAPNTDEVVSTDCGEGVAGSVGGASGSRMGGGRSSRPGPPGAIFPGGIAGPALPSRSAAKKQRKGLAIYDNYRTVRPPSSNWDKKTRYEPIGQTHGADYDDIFVISTLFHHMSIVRVRVPTAVLTALSGDQSGDAKGWGRLEMVRSPWYDFFRVEERLEAMRMTWATLAFLMRKQETEDVKMADAA